MDLSTNYLGLRLTSPLVVGASPFCDSVYQAKNLEEIGAGAVVLRSLFEEFCGPGMAAHEQFDSVDAAAYQRSPEAYGRHIAELKRDVTIPVIASLNGSRKLDWGGLAAQMESAGADAIELNFYRVVTDTAIAPDEVEREMLEAVRLATQAVKIPVAVKLSPYHSATAQLAVALELAGASGVVLFNRFYQPDINVDELVVQPQLKLSVPEEVLLRLRWLAILAPKVRGTLIANGGFHSANDIIKAMLAGASAVQIVSVLLRHGPLVMRTLHAGIMAWMAKHSYESLDQYRGLLALDRIPDPSAYERANYLRTLMS